MEQIMDVIKKRISIRRYQDRPLSEDTVRSLLEAARYAPSARNLQQLEYKVITGKTLIAKLSAGIAELLKKNRLNLPTNSNFFYHAPLLIIISGPKENPWIDTDAGLAAQNIMLYAASLDLGTCFIGMARFIERDPALLHEIHIGTDKKIAAAVVCGYPDETPSIKEKRLQAEFFS